MKRWIKVYINEWLEGSIRVDLTSAERGVWVDLLLLGGLSRNEGRIERSKGIPYEDDALVNKFEIDEKLLKSTLEKCFKEGRLQRAKDGALVITNWGKYQAVPDGKEPYLEDPRDRELRERKQTRVLTTKYPDEAEHKLESLKDD